MTKDEITLDCGEAINEISDFLIEADGELIVKIYNQVSTKRATYMGDNLISVEQDE